MKLKTNSLVCECGGTGYIPFIMNGKSYVKKCYCLFRGIKLSKFGSEYVDKGLDNWVPKNKSQIDILKIIINKPKENYFIWGNVRLGKTHLLAGIYEERFQLDDWENTKVFTEEDLLKEIEIEDNWGKVNRKKDLQKKIETREITSIIIDDVLKASMENLKKHTNDMQKQSLYYFYEHIAKWNCGLTISCNYSLKVIYDVYGAAICSRIDERVKSLEIV